MNISKKWFFYINTPIITSNDGEGAGEMFRVSTLKFNKPNNSLGNIDFKDDFLEKKLFSLSPVNCTEKRMQWLYLKYIHSDQHFEQKILTPHATLQNFG